MEKPSFPSKEELLLQCNTIRQRQERIIQVRQQSKQMSAAILEKVKREARKQSEEIENQVLAEIRNYHQKELEYSRKQYEKCISEINHLHYLQQVNVNSKSSGISNKKTVRNLSPIKSATSINHDRKNDKLMEEKSTVQPVEKRTNSTRNPNEKSNDKKIKTASGQKYTENIVIDSDDDQVKKCAMLNFRKHSPEVKHLKSLQRENETGNRSKCRRKSTCPNAHKSKLMYSKTKDDHVITNDKFSKTQIDEMYNHLVHDRIRILEQKDKILDRRTMFLPNGTNVTKKPPRFSEYFARFHSSKIPPTTIDTTVQSNTSRKDSGINEVLNDMKRIELKKKSLASELTELNEATHSKTISLIPKKQNDKKEDSPRNLEKPASNLNSIENSPASISSESSSIKIPHQNASNPSQTSKKIHDSSRESDNKEKIPSKRRPCKRKLRSKDIQVTVSSSRKSITIGSGGDTVPNTQHNNTSSSSSTHKNFHHNTKAPVKLVVNVLPSSDCTIAIKSSAADKRYLSCTSKQNVEKVRNWRTLFKNQEKLTESSYFSPPECDTKIPATSSEEFNEHQALANSANNIGYYVRKLLLMSPESVDDLDVSSCDTTLIKDSSKNISTDSDLSNKQVSFTQNPSKRNQFTDAENHVDDSENVRKLLLECLRLATAESDNINLTSFKSVDSSCDKMLGNSADIPELNDSNIYCKDLIDAAIQRLLPLYQNSLDDNLDYTTQSQRILNLIEDQSEVHNLKDNSVFISPSAYLQKFNTPENPDKSYDIIDCLKQYIESQPSADNSNKISQDSYDYADNQESKDESGISLPSVEELIRKGLISKTYETNETQNEPKEFLNEEEFIKKMLQTDFISKESHLEDDSGQSERNNDDNHQSDQDERYTTDIRRELRNLGLNWMDTTLQRTLQASIINSASSTEDSAGPLRNNSKVSSNYCPGISLSTTVPTQQPKLQSREFLNISPIEIPNFQLSLPQCFQKN